MFEVRFLDYTNPGQRDWQNRCCSGQEVQGSCSSSCSTFFNVCLRPLTDTSTCVFGQKSSDVLGNSSFVIPSNSLIQVPWPASLQSWPVRMNSPLNLSPAMSAKLAIIQKRTIPFESTAQKLSTLMYFSYTLKN